MIWPLQVYAAMSRAYIVIGDDITMCSVIQNCWASSLQHKPTEHWSSACKQRPITQNLSGLNTATHGELLQVTL